MDFWRTGVSRLVKRETRGEENEGKIHLEDNGQRTSIALGPFSAVAEITSFCFSKELVPSVGAAACMPLGELKEKEDVSEPNEEVTTKPKKDDIIFLVTTSSRSNRVAG